MTLALWGIGYLLGGALTALLYWRLWRNEDDMALLMTIALLWPATLAIAPLMVFLGSPPLTYEEWREERRRRLRAEREARPAEVTPVPMRPMPEAMFDNLAEDAMERHLELLRRLADVERASECVRGEEDRGD